MTVAIVTALAAFPAGYIAGTLITTARIRRHLRQRALITRHLLLTTRQH